MTAGADDKPRLARAVEYLSYRATANSSTNGGEQTQNFCGPHEPEAQAYAGRGGLKVAKLPELIREQHADAIGLTAPGSLAMLDGSVGWSGHQGFSGTLELWPLPGREWKGIERQPAYKTLHNRQPGRDEAAFRETRYFSGSVYEKTS